MDGQIYDTASNSIKNNYTNIHTNNFENNNEVYDGQASNEIINYNNFDNDT